MGKSEPLPESCYHFGNYEQMAWEQTMTNNDKTLNWQHFIDHIFVIWMLSCFLYVRQILWPLAIFLPEDKPLNVNHCVHLSVIQ